MNSITANGKELGLIVIAAGRVSDITKLSDMDPIVRRFISGQNGLAISGNAMMHSYYYNDLNYEEKNAELKAGQALLYNHGTAEKIKLVEE